ncbi:MAG: hypothetical protein ACYC2R_09180 [Burkholderiales bacterium]
MSVSMLLSALLERYGRPTITFEEAAQALSYTRIQTAYAARRRKKFPLRVIDIGGRLGCTVLDLAEFLVTGKPQGDKPSEPQKKKPGRPTNVERAERARRTGIEGGL